MGLCGWMCTHKLLLLFLAATVAFAVATFTLAAKKSQLLSDLEHCQDIPETSTEMAATTTITTPLPDLEKYRLPSGIGPVAYDLTFYPDLVTGLFEGRMEAKVRLEKDVEELVIHSNGLTIERVQINGKAAKWEELKFYELLVLSPEDGGVVREGDCVVTIEYKGDMKNRIVGLYMSRYKGAAGDLRSIATSKFEPTYARQAFPCFDEPNMKATYTVHILKPQDATYIALSNMPEQRQEVVANGVMVHFQESVKMSTYLSCFIVCDFESSKGMIHPEEGRPPVPIQVYATPAQLPKTAFALEVGIAVIEYFIKYFGIDYPLPKLDLIAIPDFVSGAMEHWGLVTFRETALLYSEEISSTANKQRVATVISHELAHSWFGNLVTMKWWNDLWLNEGFASYIEYKGVDYKFKDWQMMDQFLIDDLHSVLSLDSTPASHPIVQNVVTPDQITEIFDSITYNKGASILRMLEAAVTEDVFQRAVKNYLTAHQWGNAVTQDFLDEIQKLVDKDLDINEFMNTWTVQMGYPILDVKEEGENYILTQKRFLKDYTKPGNVESSYKYIWTIPVTYVTDQKPDEHILSWFNHDQPNLKIKKPQGVKWLKFNHNQLGYYRVNYGEEHWKTLINNIDNIRSISDKTHLLEESFSIAESGDLSYGTPLDLTKYLTSETNYIPWSVAATKLGQLKKYLVDSPEYSNYLKYLVSIVTPAVNELTWEEAISEAHLRKRARVTVLDFACASGHSDCLDEAYKRFQNWLEKPLTNPLSQDLRSIVYRYGMANSGKDEWEKVLELYKAEIDANEKLNLLRGLSSVKETWLLKRLIEIGAITGDEQVIRSQDYFTMLQYISANPIGEPIVWDYVRENWNDLVERFTINDRYLGRLIPAITKGFTMKIKLQEMETFFAENPNAGAGKAAREEALANVNNNIKWIANNRKSVEEWIGKNKALVLR